VGAEIDLGSWPIPPLFRLVRELTPQMPTDELYRTLNMGIGMVVVCSPGELDALDAAIDEQTWVIGRLVDGDGTVSLRESR
jgi:phosphoribosylaminoimidazole (AIR) synthetase